MEVMLHGAYERVGPQTLCGLLLIHEKGKFALAVRAENELRRCGPSWSVPDIRPDLHQTCSGHALGDGYVIVMYCVLT